MPAPIFLLAFANDLNDFLPDLAQEIRVIQELLERPDSLCEAVVRPNARLDDIIKVFQHPNYKDRIVLFQFSGHARADGIILENDDHQASAADVEGLAQLLSQQQQPPIVILNACASYRFVEILLDYHIPCVIATEHDIEDALAVQFAKVFYQSLIAGNPLQRAVDEAQAAVLAQAGETERAAWFFKAHPGRPDILDWNLPAAAQNPLFGLPPLPQQEIPAKPFRHLAWFGREHADLFFGRGADIRKLYNFITTAGMPPLILLYGQSGVGKSSLLAAGLLPRLEKDWETVYLRRDAELGVLGTLREKLTLKAQKTQTAQTSLNQNTLASSVSLRQAQDTALASFALNSSNENTLVPFVSLVPLVLNFSEKPLLIVIDQLEEAFTRPNNDLDELETFFTSLRDLFATQPHTKIILGFRKEWLAEIRKNYLETYVLSYKEVFLKPLNRAGIIEAITQPANDARLKTRYSLSIDDGLAERIALKLSQDSNATIAPTLQILLDKLWTEASQANPAAPVFSTALYETLEQQGVYLHDFLAQTLDQQLAQAFPPAYQSGLLLDLLYLHTTPLGTAAQQNAADLHAAYPHVENLSALVQALKDCHLLSDPRDLADTATRLSHDTLAPLIRERFELSDKAGQRARRVLENRGVDWQDGKQGAVLDEADLTLVEQGREGMRDFSADEQRLYRASCAARERQKLAWMVTWWQNLLCYYHLNNI